VSSRLELTRQQILAFRRRAGGLEERVPKTPESLRRAAWAGLQDSMPRAALLSLHARVEGVEPSTWEDRSLAQLWGPRYNAYVVPKRDFALFSVGRLPDSAKGRQRAERMAELLHAGLQGARMTDREVAHKIGVGNAMRYATTTGTIAIRWEGARAPVIWTVPAPKIEPADACRELARRYLHVFGPTTAQSFARWAGISRSAGAAAFASLEGSLVPVRSPLGDEWLLADDEGAMRAGETADAPARLLPSGDAYFLLHGKEREFLVRPADRRALLWTSRVWPGALLVEGEIRGTWRRSQHVVTVDAWERLSRGRREAIEAEAGTLPLPGLDRLIEVVWR
jgi:DNA glycosylase AlkZ-like